MTTTIAIPATENFSTTPTAFSPKKTTTAARRYVMMKPGTSGMPKVLLRTSPPPTR